MQPPAVTPDSTPTQAHLFSNPSAPLNTTREKCSLLLTLLHTPINPSCLKQCTQVTILNDPANAIAWQAQFHACTNMEAHGLAPGTC